MTNPFSPDDVFIQFKIDHGEYSAGDVIRCDEPTALRGIASGILRPAPCNAIHQMYMREFAKQGVTTHGKIMQSIRREFEIPAECSDSAERMKTARDLSQILDIPMDDLL